MRREVILRAKCQPAPPLSGGRGLGVRVSTFKSWLGLSGDQGSPHWNKSCSHHPGNYKRFGGSVLGTKVKDQI